MLAKEITAKYGGRVRFVSEDWGKSKLAERFHVTRYPVLFVNDMLFARPNDFGWYGAKGKYTPWNSTESHDKFKQDLSHTLDLVLSGDLETVRRENALELEEPPNLAQLPDVLMRDLDGKPVSLPSFKGKIVLVEFWATWCVPCRPTLAWLGELRRKYGDRIEVLAIAVESDEADVRKFVEPLNLPVRVLMGNKEIATSFGDINAVPTMFIFDGAGKTAAIFHGAFDDLHERVERTIQPLLK